MTQERFLQILEAYGADPARWPQDERAEAEAFAAAHPEFVGGAIALEQQLDTLLDGIAETPPSDMLEHRILRALPSAAPVASWGWRAPVATAAALLVGVCLGFASGAFTASGDEVEALYADAFMSLDEDWVDWLGDGA